MKNFLSSLLATIIGILVMTILGVIILTGIIAASTSRDAPKVEENSLLVARFNGTIADRVDENPFSRWMAGYSYGESVMGLNQILEDLDKAEQDENIEGIFLRLGNVTAGFATLGEIREALLDFKESGKFIYAYSDLYTQRSYYLATVADSIFMTPEGMFLFNGLGAEVTFYKNALEKVGVEMQVIRHGEYKEAGEIFTREDLSDEFREQLEGYVGALWEKMVGDIAESRSLTTEQLNRYADELATMNAESLMETGMIDGLIYYDEMLSLMKEKLGVEQEDDLEAISLAKYKDVPRKEKREYTRDKIAVIYGSGIVVDGNAGEGFIASERISKAIRKARRDESVKAIIFRINTGGGSSLASDVIYRESMLAAEEKPFVVSVGNAAASGGYYFAVPADTIVASEGSIVGSIGVIFTLPNMQELLNDKLGITTDVVKTNRHANLLTVADPLDEEETALIQSWIDDTYDAFVDVVSEGRGMTREEVNAIGGGRVFAGREALELGLIDVIGGMETSLELAAEMAGLDNYRIQSLPYLEDPLTSLMKSLSGMSHKKAEKILREELGEGYAHYATLRRARQMQGLQYLMPFELEVR